MARQVDGHSDFRATVIQTRLTSYDLVAYPGYTHPQTHPDRLAVIGVLSGLEPAPVNRCRVLELGCGNGSNLVPMAWGLPESDFVGIDLAAHPIAYGQRMISDLGITNVRLIHGNITEARQDRGKFDYLIAHGLFSWVPAEVREQLLAICRSSLAPQGIAFVSYNALPGGHLRNMLREMMLFHVRGVAAAEERVRQAQALVRFLAEAQDTRDEYRLWLKAELEGILDHDEGHLYHDELAELNEPFYFTRFMERATAHGLQYVGEADYFEMFDHSFSESVRQTLGQLSLNRIVREQYLDFLKCRRFRQTLLCHQEVCLRTEPRAEKVSGFLVSSPARCITSATDLRPGTVSAYQTPKGARCETDFALGKAALAVLERAWPMPLPFEEVLQQAMISSSQERVSDPNDGQARERLSEFLLKLYSAGVVQFRAGLPPIARGASERPVASPVARWQAQHGDIVTSMFHIAVKVEDEIGRHLLSWLDGTLDRKALLERVWFLLESKKALVVPNGDETAARREIELSLENNLEKLARLGLLVG
ncbi:MAG: hypothetical protein DME22_25055 [Verrucomicrobia bacterium]|nr:MAG: hypothetical protein DME22_25055 [Verrucomicrobiota bacterium]